MNKTIDIFSFVGLPLPTTKRNHSKWDLGKDFPSEVFKEKKTEDQNPNISEDFDEDVSEMATRWTGGNENELTNFGVTQPWTFCWRVNESDCTSSFYSYFLLFYKITNDPNHWYSVLSNIEP